MITSDAWRGKRYAVLGLARSGLATVRALVASGAEVVAWDNRVEARNAAGVPLGDPLDIDLSGFDAIIVSPGVPLNRHPIAAKARDAEVSIIGDIELFAQARASLPPHKVVGITGTNGKSTTTALIHHILKTAGMPSLMGGNIGLPILEQEPLPEGGVYVLELSSFQIDLTLTLDCDAAIFTTLTPDHLDRYDSFKAYAQSKLRLVDMMGSDRFIIMGEAGQAFEDLGLFDQQEADDELEEEQWDEDAYQALLKRDWPALRGPHNEMNAFLASDVCDVLGVSDDAIERGLHTFPGLPHRMERVRERGDVLFVNDSKATNPDSVAPALAAYPAVHWILGGQAKTDDLDACAPHFDHVRAAYTIGEAAPMFARLLSAHMPVAECGVLDVAVASAAQAAKPGETVLLSPACASFDQFRDYEHRGDTFRALVEALP